MALAGMLISPKVTGKSRDRERKLLFNHWLEYGIQDEEELEFCLQEYLGLTYPKQAFCRHHHAPFRVISEVFFHKVRNMMLQGSRSSGKTKALAGLNQVRVNFYGRGGVEVAHAAATKVQSERCHRYTAEFHRDPLFYDLLEKDITKTSIDYKNGSRIEILTGSVKGFNSPHPLCSNIDEFDLIDYEVLKEGLSMSRSMDDIPGSDIFASTLRYKNGTMQRLMDESEERGLTLRSWCVYDMAQQCKRDCFNDKVYGDCPIYSRKVFDPETHEVKEEILCGGKLHDASPDGHIRVDDIIQKARILDAETWKTQWGSEEPESQQKVYPAFSEKTHSCTWEEFQEITGYERPPAFWDGGAGLDLGSVMAYELCAVEEVYFEGATFNRYWFYKEVYDDNNLTTAKRAAAIKNKDTYWRGRLIIADYANKQERLDLEQESRLSTVEAIKEVVLGFRRVRSLTEPAPDGLPYIMFISEECPWAIRQMTDYSHPIGPDGLPDKTEVIKRNDHAPDAIRYFVHTYELLYKGRSVVKSLSQKERQHGSKVTPMMTQGLQRQVF